MKKTNTWIMLTSLLAVMALLLAACGGEPTATTIPLPTETPAVAVATNTTAPPADTPTTAPAADTPTTAPAADTPTTAATTGGADIKVGVAFVTSGDNAIYGKSQQPAVELAFEEINAKGGAGGHKLVGVFEDTAGKPDQAKSVFQKLINSDKVLAIIGPTLSGEAKTADPDAQAAGVPVLGVSNTAAGITDIGDYIFRDSLTENVVVPETVKQTVAKYSLKTVALMYGNDDAFTKSGADAMRAALQANGVTIADAETFANTDTDFKVQLTKINNLNPKPQAVFISALGKAPALILSQARVDVGIPNDVILAGGNGFNSPAVLKAAGDAAEGFVVGAAWNIASTNERNTAFIAAYKAKTGNNPDQFAAQAYAGAYILAHAIGQAKLTGDMAADRTAIRDALKATKDVPTVLGSFNFTEKRDANHPPVVQVVEKGAFSVLK